MDRYWKQLLGSDNKSLYSERVREINKDINGYIEFDPEKASYCVPQEACASAHDGVDGSQQRDGGANGRPDLRDIPFAVKCNIALEGNVLSCASGILADFVSPYTASALVQLLKAGLRPVGQTNMDEFAMGSSSANTIYDRVNNPWDLERTCGGSSGGSAAVVAAGTVPFSLGSDTGGSVRQPATFCGLWGLKPTYGAVSRYGLVAFASSLDVIGLLCEHPKWLAPVFNIMRVKGKDPHDASSYYPDTTSISTATSSGSGSDSASAQVGSGKAKKIAIYIPSSTEEAVVIECLEYAKQCYEKKGYEIERINLDVYEYSPAVYINISTAEASSNLARFDGIRYGNRGGFADNPLELIRNARNKGFGKEVKVRVLTGGFVLRSGFQDQYYLKAQKLRQHIKSVVMDLFKTYDLIISPSTTGLAFRFDDPKMSPFQQKLDDAYSVVSNLAGTPSISCPIMWKDGLPIGLQVMAPHYAEDRLFDFVNDTYELFEYKLSPHARDLFNATGRELKGDWIS